MGLWGDVLRDAGDTVLVLCIHDAEEFLEGLRQGMRHIVRIWAAPEESLRHIHRESRRYCNCLLLPI